MLCIECDVISDELNTCGVMHSICIAFTLALNDQIIKLKRF